MKILDYRRFYESVLLKLTDNSDEAMISKISELDRPPSKILEISCGNGADSIKLKEMGYLVTCTDNNPDYVENSRKNGINSIIHDTSQPFPFDDGEFDVTYSRLGLHYFDRDKLEEIFSEIARITKRHLVYSVKVSEDDIRTGKVILSPSDWREITERNFKVLTFEEKSGLLYGNQSRWLEITAEKIHS